MVPSECNCSLPLSAGAPPSLPEVGLLGCCCLGIDCRSRAHHCSGLAHKARSLSTQSPCGCARRSYERPIKRPVVLWSMQWCGLLVYGVHWVVYWMFQQRWVYSLMNRSMDSWPTRNGSLPYCLTGPPCPTSCQGICISNGQAWMYAGLCGYVIERWNKQSSSFLRRLMRPGKEGYFMEEMGWVQGCWSRRFHSFSPRYLGTFVGLFVVLCLGLCCFVLFWFGTKGTRFFCEFLQVLCDIKSHFDRQCPELDRQQREKNLKGSRGFGF